MENTPLPQSTPPPPPLDQLPPSSPPPPPAPFAPPSVPPASGRKFPKLLIFIPLIILLGLALFLAFKFISSRTQTETITYWGLWESEAVMRPIFDQFEKTHPRIKVNYQLESLREYRERLTAALAQDRGPDIFRLHDSWVPMFQANLTPVPASVFTTAAYESIFYPAVKDTLRLGTSYAGIPLEYDGLVMFVNDDLLAQSGLPAPQNWDDLRKAATTMTKCDTPAQSCPGGRILVSGAALGTTDNVDHWQDVISVLMLQNNVDLNNPSGPAANDVIGYYNSFSRSLGVWDSTLPASTQSFAQGQVGIYFAPSWRTFDIKAINPRLRFSLHPIPQLPLAVDRGEKPVNWASFWIEGVNSKSPHAAASWTLLQYLSSPEVMVQLYQQQKTSGRDFGEPYSRVDLANQLASDALVSPVLSQAPLARTWYLSSATADGPTGLNTQLSDAFAQAINSGDSASLPGSVSTILAKYGLSTSSPFTR